MIKDCALGELDLDKVLVSGESLFQLKSKRSNDDPNDKTDDDSSSNLG